MKILITGASGFIGQTLYHFLKKHGLEVTGFTRDKNKAKELGLSYVSYYTEIKAEGTLVHLAECSYAPSYNDSNIPDLQLQTLKKLCSSDFNKVFYVSSALVYNLGEKANTEEQDLTQDKNLLASSYKKYKLQAEELVSQHPNHQIIRLSNVYGPQMSERNVFWDIFKSRNSEIINLRNSLSSTDFIFVEDVAEGILKLLKSNATGVYNLSYGESVKIYRLVEIICELSQNIKFSIEDASPDESKVLRISNEKLENTIGWTPKTTIQEGLKKTYLELFK